MCARRWLAATRNQGHQGHHGLLYQPALALRRQRTERRKPGARLERLSLGTQRHDGDEQSSRLQTTVVEAVVSSTCRGSREQCVLSNAELDARERHLADLDAVSSPKAGLRHASAREQSPARLSSCRAGIRRVHLRDREHCSGVSCGSADDAATHERCKRRAGHMSTLRNVVTFRTILAVYLAPPVQVSSCGLINSTAYNADRHN